MPSEGDDLLTLTDLGMEANSPEERHDSSDGGSSQATAASVPSNDKPIVILVIGDCATPLFVAKLMRSESVHTPNHLEGASYVTEYH